MNKIEDSKLQITKVKGKYVFHFIPDKGMIEAMRIFIKDKELQDPNRFGMCDDPWFAFFRSMPKRLWRNVKEGKPILLDRKRVICINGEFFIKKV